MKHTRLILDKMSDLVDEMLMIEHSIQNWDDTIKKIGSNFPELVIKWKGNIYDLQNDFECLEYQYRKLKEIL